MKHSDETLAAARRMAAACAKALKNAQETGYRPLQDVEVTLQFPKPWRAPPGFPKRTTLSVSEDGKTQVCALNAYRLIAWLEMVGMIEIAVVEDGDPAEWTVRDKAPEASDAA